MQSYLALPILSIGLVARAGGFDHTATLRKEYKSEKKIKAICSYMD